MGTGYRLMQWLGVGLYLKLFYKTFTLLHGLRLIILGMEYSSKLTLL